MIPTKAFHCSHSTPGDGRGSAEGDASAYLRNAVISPLGSLQICAFLQSDLQISSINSFAEKSIVIAHIKIALFLL